MSISGIQQSYSTASQPPRLQGRQGGLRNAGETRSVSHLSATNLNHGPAVTFGARMDQGSPGDGTEKRALLKNLLDGFIDPIRSLAQYVVKKPIEAMLVLGSTIAVLNAIPILGSLITIGVFGYSAVSLVTGFIKITKGLASGNHAAANQGARTMGRSVFDGILTVTPAVKGANAIHKSLRFITTAPEAKALSLVQKGHVLLQQQTTVLANMPSTFKEFLSFYWNAMTNVIRGVIRQEHQVPNLNQAQTEQIAQTVDDVGELLNSNEKVLGYFRSVFGADKSQSEILQLLNGQLSQDPTRANKVSQMIADLRANPDHAAHLVRVLEIQNNAHLNQIMGLRQNRLVQKFASLFGVEITQNQEQQNA